MGVSLSKESKSGSSLSLEEKDVDTNWDESTMIWDEATGTWEKMGAILYTEDKTKVSLSLEEK